MLPPPGADVRRHVRASSSARCITSMSQRPVLRRRAFYQTAMFAELQLSSGRRSRSCLPDRDFTLRKHKSDLSRWLVLPERSSPRSPGRLGDQGSPAPCNWNGIYLLPSLGPDHAARRALVGVRGRVAIVIDAAVQTTLVCGQQIIYNLRPDQRSRLNTLFIATFFVGGALGSAISSWAYDRIGWEAVVIIGTALSIVALAYWLTEPRKTAV